MRANAGESVAAFGELSGSCTTPDGVEYMQRLYMDPRLYVAHWSVKRHVESHDGTNACGSGAYWTKIGVTSFLMDDVTTFAILLVIHDECHRGGSS